MIDTNFDNSCQDNYVSGCYFENKCKGDTKNLFSMIKVMTKKKKSKSSKKVMSAIKISKTPSWHMFLVTPQILGVFFFFLNSIHEQ